MKLYSIGGFVNRHNCHYWADGDHRVTWKSAKSKVTVWGVQQDRYESVLEENIVLRATAIKQQI